MESEVLSEKIEWECKRMAAAFGIEEWSIFGVWEDGVLLSDGWYSGAAPISGVALTWCIDAMLRDRSAEIREISVYDRGAGRPLASLKLLRYNNGPLSRWKFQIYSGGHDPMARGLYRLGFEDEAVLAKLNYLLTAHEKLELRLSMPREFWPQKWLDEAKAE